MNQTIMGSSLKTYPLCHSSDFQIQLKKPEWQKSITTTALTLIDLHMNPSPAEVTRGYVTLGGHLICLSLSFLGYKIAMIIVLNSVYVKC